MLEIEAAKALKSVLQTITDDEDAIADTIEGETNLHEAIAAVMRDITEDEILLAGLEAMLKTLSDRKARIEYRIERRRAAILRGMEVGELKRLELPEATLSIRRVPPVLEITDEAQIPEIYWKPQPLKLDKAVIKSMLAGGENIPGAVLGNGSQSLSVRRR